MKVTTELEFKSRGGAWLGRIRSWIQHNCINGSTVTWGSNELLKSTKEFTPALMEDIASEVAWAAVREDREKYARPAIFELEMRDLKIKILATIITNRLADYVSTTSGDMIECPYCHMRKLYNDESMKLSEIDHCNDCVYVSAQKWLAEVIAN